MYPFGSLPSNLVAFGTFLRSAYGFKVGPSELHDTARAVEIVDLADESAVRNALRPILSRTSGDAGVFDQAFSKFFFPGSPSLPQQDPESIRRESGKQPGQTEKRFPDKRARSATQAEEENGREAPGAIMAPLAIEKAEVMPALLARAGYSPLEVEAILESPRVGPVAPAWRNAARLLVRRLDLRLVRRWRPAVRGPRFDLRRTLRASLQTGGEAIAARWLRRPRRSARFVLLIDGSRSMNRYAQTALEIAVAIASVTMRVEVFAFSTGLQCVTKDVRRAAAGEMRSFNRLQYAWGGGTTIGRCLREFIRRFGGRMARRDTVLIIMSDGLDLGEPDVLRGAMSDLHRRSAAVVWLNPLIETRGYEPTAQGMSTARPYITTFSAANDLAGFARLSTLVAVRR
jgi:uncharacterized protein